MAHGGNRPGAGRGVGSKSKINQAMDQQLDKEAIAAGVTPLQVMLQIMRNPKSPAELRLDAARAAAPYVHRRQPADVFVTQYNDPLGTEASREAAVDALLERIRAEVGIVN
jgi:hypothetical protein